MAQHWDAHISQPIPASVLNNLWSAGIHSLGDIMHPSLTPPTLISNKDLQLRLGKNIDPKHLLALTRLTGILTNQVKDHSTLMSLLPKDLSPTQRLLSPLYFKHLPYNKLNPPHTTLPKLWAHLPPPNKLPLLPADTVPLKRTRGGALKATLALEMGHQPFPPLPAKQAPLLTLPCSCCEHRIHAKDQDIVSCATCRNVHCHPACHSRLDTQKGAWHCPTCLQHPDWLRIHGKDITLGECIAGKPTILVLAYYRCPNLCDQTLNGLIVAIAKSIRSKANLGQLASSRP